MDRKTIVLAGSFIMPDGNALAVHYSAVAKLLENLKYKVVFISWKPELSIKNEDFLKTVYDDRECFELPYPNGTVSWIKSIFASKIYKKILREIGLENIYAVIVDGIKCHNIYSLYRFCKKNNIYYVYHLSEWPKVPIDKSFKSVINVLSAKIEMNLICPEIKNVISVSKFAAEQLNKHEKMNVIQMPVFNDQYDDRWDCKEYYKAENIIKIGYAGNLDQIGYKERIDWLVLAACKINQERKKLEIHLVGITEDMFKKACPKITELPAYPKTVVFYGHKEQRECVQIIGQMDYNFIVRNPSWNMKCGFPTKLGESFACGVPVLISDFAYINEFVEEGVTGWMLKDITYEGFEKYLRMVASTSKEKRIYMHKQCEKSSILDFREYIMKIGNYLKYLK